MSQTIYVWMYQNKMHAFISSRLDNNNGIHTNLKVKTGCYWIQDK